MKMRYGCQAIRLVMVGLLTWSCLLGTAWAQTVHMTPQGIAYVSGGIGDDERAILESLSGQYTLKLEFAKRNRDYLGDVRVILRGPVSLDVISDGPIFLAKLPAGTYSVTAIADGMPRTQTVTVSGTKLKAAALFW
jgi:hypothetical protein